LVAAIAGPREVGLYAVATTVAELVWVPTWALSQATKETQAGAEPADAGSVTARAVRMTLVLSALCAAGLAAVAPVGLGLVFGADFDAALTAVWILLPAAAAMAIWRLLTVFLARMARLRVTAGITLTALTVNVGLNLVLIPPLGIAGAALASLCGYGCGAVLAGWWFRAVTGTAWKQLVPRWADVKDLADLLRPRALRRRLGELRALAGA
jgi:O-antigen/teichoic acid export membrane protein